MDILEKFKDGQFVVSCNNKNESDLFLKICANYGFTKAWRGSDTVLNDGIMYCYERGRITRYGVDILDIIDDHHIPFISFIDEYCKEFGNKLIDFICVEDLQTFTIEPSTWNTITIDGSYITGTPITDSLGNLVTYTSDYGDIITYTNDYMTRFSEVLNGRARWGVISDD
jgi:hypothetical protein